MAWPTKQPDYLAAFDRNMSRTWAHMFNMFIMRRDRFDAYVDWLFDILFAVEARVQADVETWDSYEQRVYGYYRRFFSFSRQKDLAKILTSAQLADLLAKNDVILPKKRRYWIESSDSHYRHAHHEAPLDILREVIADKVVPVPDETIYTPIQVGAALSAERFSGFISDDTGRNISEKNPYFNELTAIYWARHNSDAEVIGLVAVVAH
ncbi:DUF4422 domain-containing protein|uniref:DUF4422 domain-containing protein n=1 Tax=Leuconostoc lactis TaxID=1246 RepID=A0A6L7AD93_LEULA|nr:DUF4422 domain-containing protein [Leuconostoc lactis]